MIFLRSTIVAVFFATVASAQEPIRFPRTPDISPDGKQVAFSYLGDIWTVETIGGIARPVTMHEAHDINPCFSPDGRWVAFSSNRHGSYDVFVVAAVGGKPRRLTYDSGQDIVTGWSPDGKSIFFTTSRSAAYPSNLEAYSVPLAGGSERKLPLFEAKEAYPSPDGKAIAFVRGPGTWYRRGYRGSSNDDIWLSNTDGSEATKITNFEGQDASPMWSPDGRKLFYVSEQDGPKGFANIVVQDLDPGTPPKARGTATALTTHREESVRRARLSGDGRWIVYECGPDLWVVGTAKNASPPRKLAIEVHADDKLNAEKTTTFSRDATEFNLSPDEKFAVLAVRGELFLTKVPDGGKATRLTESAAYDHGASFSPDGKSILFASDRSGVEDLYMIEPDDAEHPELTKAHKFKVKALTSTPEEESAASFSPRGDRIAFIRRGQLWLMKTDGSDQKPLVAEKQVFDYDWSPDGKHIVFARMDGSFASELYIVPSDSSEKPRNITRYATFNGDVTWSRSGNRIGFIGQRQGTYQVHVIALQKPATGGGSTGSDIDWDDIHLRTNRPSTALADISAISPDGTQTAFKSNGELWIASADGRSVNRITSTGQSPQLIRWARRSPGTVYFLNGSGEIRIARSGAAAGLPSIFGGGSSPSLGSEPAKVPFLAKMTIHRDDEFGEMFAQCWRKLSDFFYDPAHHGTDWRGVRERYRPLVSHVAQREDLYALVSLMLGELNASHLGISGGLPTADEPTADLGLIFDETYAGPGLKVAEVLKRGPADRRGLLVMPGDIVLAIDRVPLTATTNLSQLLNNKAGEAVRLDVTHDLKDPKARHTFEITAIDRLRAGKLMYERWVDQNDAAVAKKSEGKLGYIHIPSMDTEGLETFVRALYSDNFDKEGIVLDVRYNGGGFTHDQVLNYLTGKEHTFFRQRDGGEGLVLRSYDRKWTRPVTLLINNRSYSDAEIFPHAFRSLGLGKLVGQATGGHVIGTTSTKLIDGSQFRIPRTGVWTNKGANMEQVGVSPDVPVDITPEDWRKGVDTQLTKAIEVLNGDVLAWKKARAAVTGTAISEGPKPGNPDKTGSNASPTRIPPGSSEAIPVGPKSSPLENKPMGGAGVKSSAEKSGNVIPLAVD